jgi:hypothetical protein
MRRRDFIGIFCSAMAWPLAARAQQPAMPMIGYLDTRSPDAVAERLRAFRQGLKETGYVERENVGIEYRWAEGQYDRLPELAAELVRRPVTAIVAAYSRPAANARPLRWRCFRPRLAGSRRRIADRDAPIEIDRLDWRLCPIRFRQPAQQLCAPAASDRLAPTRNATRPAARQRPQPMQKLPAGKFHFEPPFTSLSARSSPARW